MRIDSTDSKYDSIHVGDWITVTIPDYRPWYLKLWHRIIRKPNPWVGGTYPVSEVTSTTFTLDENKK